MTNIRYDEFLLEMFFFRKYRIAGSGDKVELFPLSEQMFLHLLHQQSNGLGANSILLYDDDDVGDDDGGDDDGDDGDDVFSRDHAMALLWYDDCVLIASYGVFVHHENGSDLHVDEV